MKNKSTLSFAPLEKAIRSLEEATKSKPKNDLERDGVIQRFEYTFEMAWKSIRTLLLALGRVEVSSSPKPLLKDAAEENLIDNPEDWYRFQEARNQTVHMYNEVTAEEVYRVAIQFPKEASKLLEKLKKAARDAK